uniref:Uncharacterized protein n=1 Tax=Arundo donax TaxID=35708 RepID=A0A0A9FEJ4_ARUDO
MSRADPVIQSTNAAFTPAVDP